MKVRVKRSVADSLLKQGLNLFFFSLNDGTGWCAESPAFTHLLPAEFIKHNYYNSALCMLRRVDDSYIYELEEFDEYNPEHVRTLLNMHYILVGERKLRFGFRELVWVLNNCDFVPMPVMQCMKEMSPEKRQFFISEFKHYAPMLSLPRQRAVSTLIDFFGEVFEPYLPDELRNAMKIIAPLYEPENDDRNIFTLTNVAIISFSENVGNVAAKGDFGNEFLKISRWLADDSFLLGNFKTLLRILRICLPSLQLKLLLRYFYAVSKHQTDFDLQVIEAFSRNRYNCWGEWYQCITDPTGPLNITLPLFCANFLAYMNQQRQRFLSEGEMLTLAYSLCNPRNPTLFFDNGSLLPVCNGGVRADKNFSGFVAYTFLLQLNDAVIASAEGIKSLAIRFLDLWASKDADGKGWVMRHIPEVRWQIINLFMRSQITFCDLMFAAEDNILDDPEALRLRLLIYFDKFLIRRYSANKRYFYYEQQRVFPHDMETLMAAVLKRSFIVVRPRRNVCFGNDVLGFRLSRGKEIDDKTLARWENQWLLSRIIERLKEVTSCSPQAGNIFFVPYSRKMLLQIKEIFRVPCLGPDFPDSKLCSSVFTCSDDAEDYDICSPMEVDSNASLPHFFRCAKGVCFRSAYHLQDTFHTSEWEHYNLLHCLEIAGRPMLSETPAGLMPKKSISELSQALNQLLNHHQRFICPHCGQLLMAESNARVRCSNPLCKFRKKF